MSDRSESDIRAALHRQIAAVERTHQAVVASERRILAAARDRLARVQTELAGLAPSAALLDDPTADRYLALIQERGRLEQTIALAEHHLKNGWE